MQVRPNSYRWFQVTAVVTNLLAVVLILADWGSRNHSREMFGTVEGLFLTGVAANLMAARARNQRP
jgi:hypothetical protein